MERYCDATGISMGRVEQIRILLVCPDRELDAVVAAWLETGSGNLDALA